MLQRFSQAFASFLSNSEIGSTLLVPSGTTKKKPFAQTATLLRAWR
jgi:hypothetical protein